MRCLGQTVTLQLEQRDRDHFLQKTQRKARCGPEMSHLSTGCSKDTDPTSKTAIRISLECWDICVFQWEQLSIKTFAFSEHKNTKQFRGRVGKTKNTALGFSHHFTTGFFSIVPEKSHFCSGAILQAVFCCQNFSIKLPVGGLVVLLQ